MNGKELANAYSELNDPIDQLEKIPGSTKLKDKGDDEAMFKIRTLSVRWNMACLLLPEWVLE